MSSMASQITSLTIVYSTVFFSRSRSKKTSKLRVTGLCEGTSPITDEFPAQRASNAENVSIWWRHHVAMGSYTQTGVKCQLKYISMVMYLEMSLTKVDHSCQFSLKWCHNECDGVSNHQPHDCLFSRLFKRKSKKTSKLRATGLFEGNSPVTGEFLAQRASNADNVSISWRHHVYEVNCRLPNRNTVFEKTFVLGDREE